jgi:tetratricopeptide (TPR) repeat protein
VFTEVELLGVCGSPRVMQYRSRNRRIVSRLLWLDVFGLRYRLPERIREPIHANMTRVIRRFVGRRNPEDVATFTTADYPILAEGVDRSIDLLVSRLRQRLRELGANLITEAAIKEWHGDGATITTYGGKDLRLLREAVTADASDSAPRLELGRALAAAGAYDEAIDHLLHAVELGGDAREAAREQLVALFGLLGEQDERVRDARPRLARALF